jgi:tetratricopeptide (TPR) repeat protein
LIAKKTVEINPFDILSLNSLAIIFWLQNKYVEAEETYRKILKITQDYPFMYSDFGHVLMQNGKYGEAEKMLRRAIELRPEYLITNYRLGECLLHNGKHEEALKFLNEFVSVAGDEEQYKQVVEKASKRIRSWNNI